jgi:Flp pilus assembly protein TadG
MMSPAPRRSAIRHRDPDAEQAERGSSALELVLVTPVLIALVFGIIQTGLVWNARHVAGAAAQHGARLARTATALQPVSTGSAASAAQDAAVVSSTLLFLRQTGGGGLREPTVTITRELGYVTVTVSATTLGVLPDSTVRVVARSRTPLEGFRP